MRLTGRMRTAPDSDAAVLLLREAVDAGIDHRDTADYYGPYVVNELIRTALHPSPAGLVLVSKVGSGTCWRTPTRHTVPGLSIQLGRLPGRRRLHLER